MSTREELLAKSLTETIVEARERLLGKDSEVKVSPQRRGSKQRQMENDKLRQAAEELEQLKEEQQLTYPPAKPKKKGNQS